MPAATRPTLATSFLPEPEPNSMRPSFRRSLIALSLASFLVAGCGSASGIKPGIPANPPDPVNATPDMGQVPPPKAGK